MPRGISARPSPVSMPGMMVWRGRFDGPMQFGWPGSTEKQLPRFWNITPEILHIRHHSLYTPRDFDLSPYFRIVKPTLEYGFDYRTLTWGKPVAELGET